VSADALKRALRTLAAHQSLSADEARAAFDVIMTGEATPSQVAALLMALRVKGETAEEVAGAAQALRDAMIRLPCERPDELVDTCGTGGGTVQTFNISTAAALLSAGAGARVAKHGNRSFTSQSGSADVLEALGVPIESSLETMTRALAEAGIVFMFAPAMHPAMRHVGPVRRELAIPTVMNVVGPLANPALAGRQVVGVAEERRMPLMAGALATLGSRHALVVHGEPGMDEVSPLGITRVLEVRDGVTTSWTIDPREHGYVDIAPADLAGALPADNALVIERTLSGEGSRGARGAIVLNAAAALYVAGKASDFAAGVALAESALDDGAGLQALKRLRTAYGAQASGPPRASGI
jgi:anthranilate phosphoribosyltransferase